VVTIANMIVCERSVAPCPSQWRRRGVKWEHAPRGAGLGGASTHFFSHL